MLQGFGDVFITVFAGLNPFEVREVLQEYQERKDQDVPVSIPLKSGRCCKYLQRGNDVENMSQSL